MPTPEQDWKALCERACCSLDSALHAAPKQPAKWLADRLRARGHVVSETDCRAALEAWQRRASSAATVTVVAETKRGGRRV